MVSWVRDQLGMQPCAEAVGADLFGGPSEIMQSRARSSSFDHCIHLLCNATECHRLELSRALLYDSTHGARRVP